MQTDCIFTLIYRNIVGAMPADYDKEDSRTGLSSPALLLSIFQGCTDQSLYLRIVETLMTYRRSVCGDLLYVMAYGTSDVLEPAIHMLNRYCPAVEIGMFYKYTGHSLVCILYMAIMH